MKFFLVENDYYSYGYKVNINKELLFFNLQWYFTLPLMLVTVTGKFPQKKNKKKRMPYFLFRKILMRNREFISFGLIEIKICVYMLYL